jgi:hypothetical protein
MVSRGNSGWTTNDIFPNLHRTKMAFMKQKKKLKPLLFLIFINPLQENKWKVISLWLFHAGID